MESKCRLQPTGTRSKQEYNKRPAVMLNVTAGFVIRLVLVSDLHQTHAPNDNQCCQSNKRINCDAVEHGFQSGFFEVGKAGIQTDGSQCSDH